MADLPEANEWPEGIYQLETSDPVLGGPEGIDNLQAKQLASRTKWLKDQIGKIVDGVTTIGSALKLATPRALSFKGAATGSGSFDGSADVEITLALPNSGVAAGTWPKVTVNAKGLVTGGASLAPGDLPEGVTAPQFDNDKTLATTEFVQRAQGNFSGQTSINAPTAALAPALAGRRIVVSGPATLTLPLLSASPSGSKFYIQNIGTGDVVVTRQGSDIIVALAKSLNSVTIPMQSNGVIACGDTNYVFEEGVAALKYAPEFASVMGAGAANQQLPGLIIKAGNISNASTATTIPLTFPVSFPNVCVALLLTPWQTGGTAYSHNGRDKSGATISRGSNASFYFDYIAIGY